MKQSKATATDAPQIETANAEHERAEIEKQLRLAKEYWLRQIQPHIKSRRLRDVELYVAVDAHQRLQIALRHAEDWNREEKGSRCPVSAEALAEFKKDEFGEPEELCRDGLKPEVLAAVAAPLMKNRTAKLTAIAAIGEAHELLMAAERYIALLPEQKRGTDRPLRDVEMAFRTVTFAEIKESNKNDSGQLPLLPPVGDKRKGKNKHVSRDAPPLSSNAIRFAVRSFLSKRTPQLTQQEYEREQEEDARRAEEGKFGGATVKPSTYQELQKEAKNTIDDCLQNNWISLDDLCSLRWDRFEKQSKTRQSAALKRSRPARKPMRKRQDKRPSSAASSPKATGKVER